MSSNKPSVPRGTRDFSPDEMIRRKYIFSCIEDIFRRYGYQPLETPAMENLSTLLGKYGEEGDKLLFKILNSGDYLQAAEEKDLVERNASKLSLSICDRGLRYDLTVPFARYVVQHRNEIDFPFKRYQIQPVWRADKPQKGRYREFYQCDVDVVGSNSLLNEAELIQIADEVFSRLCIPATIKINNRKILYGIAEAAGVPERLIQITTAVDKLEKLGEKQVADELEGYGFSREAVLKIFSLIRLDGDNRQKIQFLREQFSGSVTGMKGIEEIRQTLDYLSGVEPGNELVLDLSLARGLDYYTGAIIEVAARDVAIGSICGGGRYDDLTGVFGLPGVSGVGISFGADRIYDVMLASNLFPEKSRDTSKIMFVNFGTRETIYCSRLLKEIRENGINAEMYPDSSKMKKQFAYADGKNIPFVAIVGEEEMNAGTITVKYMKTGEQKVHDLETLIGLLQG